MSTVNHRRAVAADQARQGQVSTLACIILAAIAFGEVREDGTILLRLSPEEWSAAVSSKGQPLAEGHLRALIKRGIEVGVLAPGSRPTRVVVVAPAGPL